MTRNLFRSRRAALSLLSIAAVVAAGVATVPAAESAPDPSCPAAFPVADLVEGQPVTGLTVSKGTAPTSFTGEVVGVLDDGIAPDLDLVAVRLSSAALEQAGGVWYGMSGSPVYAADGRLIGAVSYGLSSSPSMVTGVTPAAEMRKLLRSDNAAARRSLAASERNSSVDVPEAMSRQLVSSGAAGAAEVDQGFNRLPLPVAVSGLTARRLQQAAKLMPSRDLRLYKASAAPLTGGKVDIVPGGNIAASASYGDVTWAGVGTATAVCGDEVLAFGHPFMYTGPTSLTMHGASVLLVQQEPYWGGPYKVANVGGPVGLMDLDRLAGLHGILGPPPAAATVTSYVEAEGRSRTGTTRISFRRELANLAATHMWADQDRVLEAVGPGTATAAWTVSGVRRDGKPFAYTRRDRFASRWDITYEVPNDLYVQLSQLQANEFEPATVTRIKTTSHLSTTYERFVVKIVRIRSGGTWTTLRSGRQVRLRAGTTARLRVTLISPTFGTRVVRLAVPVPEASSGRSGSLLVTGGGSLGGEEFYEGETPMPAVKSLDRLLREFETAPRNDDVVADLSFFGKKRASLHREVTRTVQAVTEGMVDVGVRVTRR